MIGIYVYLLHLCLVVIYVGIHKMNETIEMYFSYTLIVEEIGEGFWFRVYCSIYICMYLELP